MTPPLPRIVEFAAAPWLRELAPLSSRRSRPSPRDARTPLPPLAPAGRASPGARVFALAPSQPIYWASRRLPPPTSAAVARMLAPYGYT
jgi:hypothetical protein